MPTLRLTISAKLGRSFVPELRRLLPRAAARLRAPLGELSLVLIDDEAMSALHAQYMDDPSSTDVMTFPLDLDSRGRPVSGEVYVCVPEARRQARARRSTPRREVLLYALHGLLHLCGFDDRTDPEYRRMHRREDQILTALGIGPVFAPEASPRARKRRGA